VPLNAAAGEIPVGVFDHPVRQVRSEFRFSHRLGGSSRGAGRGLMRVLVSSKAFRRELSSWRSTAWLGKADPNILHDEITSIDHALTRPWTVDKKYVHNAKPHANWPEFYTAENNAQIVIGKENYFLSGDRLLMPAKKNQTPPDLRYFKTTGK
jgi:hypothetical protein